MFGFQSSGSPNYVVSFSSSAFNSAGVTFTDVTNLSVTITTTGRPVMLFLMPDGNTTSGHEGMAGSTTNNQATNSYFQFLRGSTSLGRGYLQSAITTGDSVSTSITIPPAAVYQWDFPAAGTYTYKIQIAGQTAEDIAIVNYCKLVAYEVGT